jgi:hypothetical protein
LNKEEAISGVKVGENEEGRKGEERVTRRGKVYGFEG